MEEDNKEFIDSMTPIELTKEVEVETNYNSGFDQVDSMLSQVVNLSSKNDFYEPTCPICSSEIREEAECLWEDGGKKASLVSQLFKDKTTLKVSAEIVKNHMRNHKDGGQTEIKKVEFINRVRRLYGKNVSTIDRIDLCLAVITERLMQINSLASDGRKSAIDIEKIKTAETNKLMATYSSLLKIQATILGEMKNNGEIISIPREKFITVFNEAISNSQTAREREVITDILSGLKG
jgi:hypothetical protein